MTLTQFNSFAAVAKHLNLSKASVELRVSQPAVSHHLKQLEGRLGIKLYRRRSKGVEITRAGKQFLRNISPILAQLSKLEGGYRAGAGKFAPGVLKVGGVFSASAQLLPELLACLRQRHPEAEIECRTARSAELERAVLASAIDLAVTGRKASSAALVCEPLGPKPIALFVSADHRLAKLGTFTPADLAGERLIVRGAKGPAGAAEKAVRQLRARGLAIKVGLRCEDVTALKAAVRHGMGVGVAFATTIKAEVAGGEFAVVDLPGVKLSGPHYLIYLKQPSIAPLVQELLELLRAERAR